MYKKFLMIVAAGMLALGLFGCSGQGTTEQTTNEQGSEAGSAESGSSDENGAVTEYSTGAVKVVLDGGDPIEFKVEVKDGEGLLYVSNMKSDEGVELITTMPEGDMTDCFYEGYGCSMTGLEPGTYTVTVNQNGVSGELIATSYPEDGVDVMNEESEDIFNRISAEVLK